MGKKIKEEMDAQREDFIAGSVGKGVPEKKASDIFEQVAKFAGYGFNKSHSAAYALLSYHTGWLKCHYPAAFACGLLNSQPMGFYAPAQIVRDLRAHGGEVRPVDVDESGRDKGRDPAKSNRALRASTNTTSTAVQFATPSSSACNGQCGEV